MSEGTFSIPLDDEIIKFRQHLETNDRVIFSAQFGDGKTTFLKEFIEKSQKDCFFITLHPVNYSVATNEDIFEYIKRDILVQLNKEGVLPELDLDAIFKNLKSWQYFEPVLSFVLNFVEDGAFIKKAIKIGKKIKDDYDKKKKTFDKYEESFVNQRGGLYEDDGYTQLIKAGIQHIQTDHIQKNKEGKKVILIIEDLDRIDPGHLFRILNVLGAHIDTEEQNKNKFGFDKIIAVLDYNVTRHIFAHFYGQEANYEGYMSKFYSHYKYDYSITKVAQEYLRKFLMENTGMNCEIFSINVRVESANPVSIDDIIDRLSVRRIVQILDGFNDSIDFQRLDRDFEDRTYFGGSIVYLLAFVVRINEEFSSRTILESIKDKGSLLISLFGKFLTLNKDIAEGTHFEHNGYSFALVETPTKYSRIEIFSVSTNENELSYKEIKRIYKIICSYIKDFKDY